MLVTERSGQLRMIRDGVLDPQPLAGVPKCTPCAMPVCSILRCIPKFAENQLVYFTYSKPGENNQQATALARRTARARAGLTERARSLRPANGPRCLGGSRLALAGTARST